MKFKSNFYLFFFIMTIFSSLMFLSSLSWLNMWIWLEINLISFIAFMININNKMSVESSLIYFLVQTISSIILMFSILMIMFKNNFINLMMISILMKLGSSPFHYWIPLIIEGINWMKIFLLLTWQKINPLYMMMINNYFSFLNLFIILSLIIGSISGLNYVSLKKMISFSSINQLSWMMMSLMNSKMIKMYLIIYTYMMWMIIKSFDMFNLKFLNQLYNMKNNNKFIKLFIFMNLLSLGGLPPFLGFFPKMMIIMLMNNMFIIFLLMMFSLFSLFMYLRIIFSLMSLNSMKINKIFKNINKKNYFYTMKMMLINNLILMMLIFLI